MNHQEIINCSMSMGFHKAQIIDAEKIVFDFSFRKYCEENLCGNYQKNFSCPPDCGTPLQMKEKMLKYKQALVLQSCWEIDDLSNKKMLNDAKYRHNSRMLNLIKIMKENGYDGLMAGASNCCVCESCEKIKGNACKKPDLQFSCLSAYCVNVLQLAKTCSMEYAYENGVLSFFGMYLF